MEKPLILVPEVNDPTVKALRKSGNAPENIIFQDMSLEEAFAELNADRVQAVIAGASISSAVVLRAAIDIVGVETTPSSFMLMRPPNGESPLFFSDCVVNPDPSAEKLALIAAQTCASAEALGYTAVVAFLSFSTAGSAGQLPQAQKMQDAYRLFQVAHPEIEAYGEIQFDAAMDRRIFEKKTGQRMGDSPNIFIFPDLNSGNIGYKIAEQLGGYEALLLLQGFKKPVYDLSRGVTVDALLATCDVVTQLSRSAP